MDVGWALVVAKVSGCEPITELTKEHTDAQAFSCGPALGKWF